MSSITERSETLRNDKDHCVDVGTPELLRSCQIRSKSSAGSTASTISVDRKSKRLQEKEELIALNDRLASYIDNVRNLETENVQLKTIVQNYSSTQETELKELRRIYDCELNEVRKMLDDVSRERARLEIDISRYRSSAGDTDTKLKLKEAEIDKLNDRLSRLEEDLSNFKAKNAMLSSELDRKSEELLKSRAALSDMERHNNTTKKQLEAETLLRIDYENRNLTLVEELEFLREVSEQELARVKQAAVEVANLSARADNADAEERAFNDNYMLQHLQEIRQDTEEKIEQMRIEIDTNYRRRLEDLDQQLSNSNTTAHVQKSELEQCRRRISELCTDRDHLNAKLASRDKALNDAEERNQYVQSQWEQRISHLENKLSNAQKEYQALNDDYHQLLDIKITLDQEIETYRRLVESEEDRLNITGRKRRCIREFDDISDDSKLSVRFRSSSQNSGPVLINEEDSNDFIALKNTSVHPVSIGGWVISRTCSKYDDSENGDHDIYVEHKFPRNTTIQPDCEVRVFSSNSQNGVHDPPNSFIMGKGKQWPAGDRCITKLIDLENNQVAVQEIIFDDSLKLESNDCLTDKHQNQSNKRKSPAKGGSVASKLFNLFLVN